MDRKRCLMMSFVDSAMPVSDQLLSRRRRRWL